MATTHAADHGPTVVLPPAAVGEPSRHRPVAVGSDSCRCSPHSSPGGKLFRYL